MYLPRTLDISALSQSCFLFGCRQAGKSSLLKNTVEPDMYIDLLDAGELARYMALPELLFSEIESLNIDSPLIVIDEIQKVPGLLDTVHRSIESKSSARFILTGSSARKLKRSHANMLGGRAIVRQLYPFSYSEAGHYAGGVEHFMQYGGLPKICTEEDIDVKKDLLRAYVNTYLQEEIYEESKIRNLPAFTRFLDIAAFANGSVINYSGFSQDIGVTSKTVKDYFSMLEDTLLGFMLYPFKKSHRHRVVSHPKFYFIDTGIVFALKRMLGIDLVQGTDVYGAAYEHMLITEMVKAISYTKQEIEMSFFRTSDGSEVDVVLERYGQIVPVEIKSSQSPKDLRGLKSFLKDHEVAAAYCVCRTPRKYSDGGIVFLPWQDFIAKLSDNCIFS